MALPSGGATFRKSTLYLERCTQPSLAACTTIPTDTRNCLRLHEYPHIPATACACMCTRTYPQLYCPAPPWRRRYFIEAEEDIWDYAPRSGDYCSGTLQNWTVDQAVFTVANQYSLGSK